MKSKDETQAQLDAARRQLDELTAEVARNDDKMRRTLHRELQLLQAEDLEDFDPDDNESAHTFDTFSVKRTRGVLQLHSLIHGDRRKVGGRVWRRSYRRSMTEACQEPKSETQRPGPKSFSGPGLCLSH